MPELIKDPLRDERFQRLMNQHEYRRQQEKKNLILSALAAVTVILILVDSIRLLHRAIHGVKH